MSQETVANFSRISIPLIRRAYPQLIANQIFSVEPLIVPTISEWIPKTCIENIEEVDWAKEGF
jgi:hypothetical protein